MTDESLAHDTRLSWWWQQPGRGRVFFLFVFGFLRVFGGFCFGFGWLLRIFRSGEEGRWGKSGLTRWC